MAAPVRNRPLPNHKFFMQGENKKISIVPVWYHGRMIGHGNYMAGARSDNKEMIVDSNNRPIPYKEINLPNWTN